MTDIEKRTVIAIVRRGERNLDCGVDGERVRRWAMSECLKAAGGKAEAAGRLQKIACETLEAYENDAAQTFLEGAAPRRKGRQ